MPQPIVLPPQRNPWQEFGTQLLQQNILLGMQARYTKRANQAKLKLEEQSKLEERRYQETQLEKEQLYNEQVKLRDERWKPASFVGKPEDQPRYSQFVEGLNARGINPVFKQDSQGKWYGKTEQLKVTQRDPSKDTYVGNKLVTSGVPKTPTPKWSAPKNGIDDNGNPIVYRTDANNPESFHIIKGVRPTPAKGMKIYDPVTKNLIFDTTGGTGQSASDARKDDDNEIAVKQYVAGIDTLQKGIKENESVLGPLGRGIAFLDSAVNQVALTVRAIEKNGVNVPAKEFLDNVKRNTSDSQWAKWGLDAADSAVHRSNLVSLAYLLARKNERGGRITEADFNRAMQQIGGQSGSPKQFNAILNNLRENAKSNYAIEYSVRKGKRLPSDFFDEISPPKSSADKSDDELKASLGL